MWLGGQGEYRKEDRGMYNYKTGRTVLLHATCHSMPWFKPVDLRTVRKALLIFRNYGEHHLLWSVFISANLCYIEIIDAKECLI